MLFINNGVLYPIGTPPVAAVRVAFLLAWLLDS